MMSTKPPAIIVRPGDDFPKIDKNENSKTNEFFVILCADVLVELLCWADRSRLAKLEQIGRRFHWGAVKFFREIPILRLNFELTTATWNRCYIVGNERIQIFMYQLADLPQFLRFDRVELKYQRSVYEYAPSIAEKCQSAVNYLQRIKLNNSSLIHFIGTIDKNNRSHFSDHSQLLNHLQNELLPTCGSSRRYKFEISFLSDEFSSHTKLIAKILKVPRIDCCSYVDIFLHGHKTFITHPFSIEPISDWLHRNYNGIAGNSKDIFLRICPFNSQWARKLCDHLKEAFIEAIIRVCSFTLKLESSDFIEGNKEESEIMVNKNTNEELLIVKKRQLWEVKSIEIKRCALKKNSKKSD